MSNKFEDSTGNEMSEKPWQFLIKSWKDDPIHFIDSIVNQVHPYDKVGTGPMYVSRAVERGVIPAEEFDNAAAEWLKHTNISNISENFKTKDEFPMSYKIKDLLLVVMPNRKGDIRFPKAISWFKENKEALLAISIINDGGHWENGVKRILNEYI